MPERLMLERRPASVTAAGVLAIIYGCLFTICGLCGVAGVALSGKPNALCGGGDPQQAEMQKQLEAAMERDVPAYRAVQISIPLVNLVVAVTLLVAGICLFGMRSWARTLTLVAALIAIVSTTFQAIYQVVYI